MGDEHELLARLRAGDESAFIDVVDRYHLTMVRLAATYAPSRSVAEEVVQAPGSGCSADSTGSRSGPR